MRTQAALLSLLEDDLLNLLSVVLSSQLIIVLGHVTLRGAFAIIALFRNLMV